jgi:ParB-like chromosome segregation protein Spo0J
MTYTVHPAAAVFPMLNDVELTALAEDIKEHGLRQPIVLNHDESILVDGRNRLRACEIAGADFTVTTLPEHYTDAEIIDYIVSANLRRRDLTPGQKAMVAAELEPMYAGAAKERMMAGKADPLANSREGSGRENWAGEQAAKVVGSSGRSVSDAKALKKEAPDLAEKVSDGDMTLNAATKERKARKSAPAPKPHADTAKRKPKGQAPKDDGTANDEVPQIAWASIPVTSQKKIAAELRRYQKEIEADFWSRVQAEVERREDAAFERIHEMHRKIMDFE